MTKTSTSGFTQQLQIGKSGEDGFIKYCNDNNLNVVDVTHDREYQKIDVDFIVNGYNTEIKTDNLIDKTGNFPVELVHHRKTGDRDGWYYYTQATYIIRYSIKSSRLYILYFQKCKDYILKLGKKIKWYDKQDNNYVTGILLNVDKMQELGYLRIIDI